MKILKNIFSRKSSIWLALELVLVTIACWWAYDPVLVNYHLSHLPLGYDADRLVRMSVASNLPVEQAYQNSDLFVNEEAQLVEKVQEMDGVEMAFASPFKTIGLGNMASANYYYTKLGEDSVWTYNYGFLRNSKMFEVFGIQSITPGVPTSELSHDCIFDQSVIITRTLAMTLFGTTDVAGRTITSYTNAYNAKKGDFEKVHVEHPIRAVVEDVRTNNNDRDCMDVFLCQGGPAFNMPIIVRLREGVDANKFIQSHQQQVDHELVTEHCFVRSMSPLTEISDKYYERWTSRTTRRNLLIAAFFTINLALGVIGTLLMYTRQRREEAGVKRAFGATRWNVFLGFLREAWLLTTISVLIGCTIYLQFAVSSGLYNGETHPIKPLWFDSFGTHFLVVSVFVYLVILATVLIGTAIPAWRICRTSINESIKEE